MDKTIENEAEVVESEVVTTDDNQIDLEAELLKEREEKEALLKEKQTLQEQKEHWRKKAENKDKKQDGLTTLDVLALTKANIETEDIDEIVEFAQFKKITVAEALKHSTVKTILKEKEEERRTAQATQTRGGARGTAKVSGDEILSKAAKTGQVPDSDEAFKEMFLARRAKRVEGRK